MLSIINLVPTRIDNVYKGIFTGTSLSFKVTGSDQYIDELIEFLDSSNLILGYEDSIFKKAKALVYTNRTIWNSQDNRRQYANEIKLSALLTGAQIHFEDRQEYERYVPVIKKAIERYLKKNEVLSVSC